LKHSAIHFTAAFLRQESKEDSYIFKKNGVYLIIDESRVLINVQNHAFPNYKETECLHAENIIYIGEGAGGKAFFMATLPVSAPPSDSAFIFEESRQVFPLIGKSSAAALSRALQIYVFMQEQRFCGFCGGKNILLDNEIAMQCSCCSKKHYPIINPAVLVFITKKDKILLAHNIGFPENLYSLPAGFTEAGETLEETVRREVFEELHIRVKNIQYLGSQSWPYPHSLMTAFAAEWESGEIICDNSEITAAGWFDKDSMPKIPGKIALARRIIDIWRS
jgi:NAD+ diphosphatase